MIPIDQTTAITITAFIAVISGILLMPIGFIMFINELKKETEKVVRHG